MQYLTPQQYRKWKGLSRQNLHAKIKRKTIPTVLRRVEREVLYIPVEDTELKGVNLKSLTV